MPILLQAKTWINGREWTIRWVRACAGGAGYVIHAAAALIEIALESSGHVLRAALSVATAHEFPPERSLLPLMAQNDRAFARLRF